MSLKIDLSHFLEIGLFKGKTLKYRDFWLFGDFHLTLIKKNKTLNYLLIFIIAHTYIPNIA